MFRKIAILILSSLLIVATAWAQTGGGFDLSHNVIASGGGRSTGGAFSLDATAGQALAGTNSAGGAFSLRSGFWASDALPPTAALVGVSGRVTTANGNGIRNVRVGLVSPSGITRTALTSSFGYFRFEEVEVGHNYVVQVSAKRYVFATPTRLLNVQDELADVDFVSEPE